MIVYINSVDLDEISGQGSFERNFISYLRNSNEKNIIFTINKKQNKIENNIIYIKLNKKNKLSYFFYQIYLFYFLLREIKRNKKGKIYVYNRLAPYNIVPFILKKIFKFKLTIRSGPVYQNLVLYDKIKNSFLLKFFKKLLFFYYHTADDIIVVTQKIKTQLINDFNIAENKIKVISNPINEDLFKNCKENNLKQDKKIITLGFVGNIYKEQGVQHIIEAFNLLSKTDKEKFKIIIVGDGSYLTECKILVKKYDLSKYFEFTGRVKPEKVINYISKFDLGLAPFTKEDYEVRGSSALKILEYLYCNKPVITIDVPEYRFIREFNYGYLYEMDNILNLKLILEMIIKTGINEINSKQYVLQNYSKEVVFSRYIKIIKGEKDA